MKSIAIIPARMASTRFPGKPLADIYGIPMLGHCYFRTAMSSLIDMVYIATCDDEIVEFAETINAPAVMTSEKHERASDRIAEAMIKIEEKEQEKHDVVVLVQGDEPMIHPDMIDDLVSIMLDDPTVKVANGFAPIQNKKEFEDPNEVKVVIDNDGNAIYFSREPIPSEKKFGGSFSMFKQVCIIPFRREYLLEYNSISQTMLEKIESIDMLRVLETGDKVRMVKMNHETYSVDTVEDLEKVREKMKLDALRDSYGK